jgi:hypothetical protein
MARGIPGLVSPVLRKRWQRRQVENVVFLPSMLAATVSNSGIVGTHFDHTFLGKTTSKGTEDGDLSIDVLVADFIELVQTVFKDPAVAPSFLVITSISQCEPCRPYSPVSSSVTVWVALSLYAVVHGCYTLNIE